MQELTRKEEQILLAVYSLRKNAYLITIREQIKEFTGKYYSVGTIYAPLNRLRLNGYLDSNLQKTGDTGSSKPIRYYELTQLGYDVLINHRKQTNEMWDGFADPAFED